MLFQEIQIVRIYVLGEQELGQTQPQILCFVTRFMRNDFISSDAMSKLRQVSNKIIWSLCNSVKSQTCFGVH